MHFATISFSTTFSAKRKKKSTIVQKPARSNTIFYNNEQVFKMHPAELKGRCVADHQYRIYRHLECGIYSTIHADWRHQIQVSLITIQGSSHTEKCAYFEDYSFS